MSDDGKQTPHELFQMRLVKSMGVDTRYSVLDFIQSRDYLYIFTDSVRGAIQISEYYQKEPRGFRIKVTILPDKSVGRNIKGICGVGVAPVRSVNRSASEQITQVLYGETFDALQIEGSWVRVRLHSDGYLGWVSADQVTLMDEDAFHKFQSIPKVYAAMNVVPIFEKPKAGGGVIREAVYSSALSVTGVRGKFLQIRLPDGSTGWVEKGATSGVLRAEKASVSGLLGTASRFLGISYVWGGRSAKGFDCSGFVQTVYRLNGLEIPRDSDLQFFAGTNVGKNINKLAAGDLLFFSSDGDKITHVSIFTGRNKEFIHSSGYVRVNSFDRNRKNFSKKLSSTFVGACRLI